MSFSLKDILDTLTVNHGAVGVSKIHGTEYHYIPKTDRKDILRMMVATVKENHGEDRDYFKRNDVRTIVLRACFNEYAISKWDSKKRDGAREVVFRELDQAVAEFYPSDIVSVEPQEKLEEFDPAKQGRMGKDIDTSVNDEPEVQALVDEDAAALLGLRR